MTCHRCVEAISSMIDKVFGISICSRITSHSTEMQMSFSSSATPITHGLCSTWLPTYPLKDYIGTYLTYLTLHSSPSITLHVSTSPPAFLHPQHPSPVPLQPISNTAFPPSNWPDLTYISLSLLPPPLTPVVADTRFPSSRDPDMPIQPLPAPPYLNNTLKGKPFITFYPTAMMPQHLWYMLVCFGPSLLMGMPNGYCLYRKHVPCYPGYYCHYSPVIYIYMYIHQSCKPIHSQALFLQNRNDHLRIRKKER